MCFTVLCTAPSAHPHAVMGRSVGMTWIYLVWSSVAGRGANGVIANYTVEVTLSGENENTNLYSLLMQMIHVSLESRQSLST